MRLNLQTIHNFRDYVVFSRSQGLILAGGKVLTESRGEKPELPATHSPHMIRCVNKFSKTCYYFICRLESRPKKVSDTWYFWSISLQDPFRNRPDSLRCEIIIYICLFLKVQVLRTGAILLFRLVPHLNVALLDLSRFLTTILPESIFFVVD